MESSINPKNYEKPIDYHISYNFLDLDINKANIVRLYFNKATVVSDIGIIGESNIKKNLNEFHHVKISTLTNVVNNNIAEARIYVINHRKHYYRIYLKIPQAFAEVGGIFPVIMTVCTFIYDFYIDTVFTNHLLKRLFKQEFDDENCPNEEKIDNHVNISKLQINADNGEYVKNLGEFQNSNIQLQENMSINPQIPKNIRKKKSQNYNNIDLEPRRGNSLEAILDNNQIKSSQIRREASTFAIIIP